MKIIKLKHSILFLTVDTKSDTVKAFFIFSIAAFTFKIERQIFDLDKVSMANCKEFYTTLADDYNRKYRI